MSPVIRERAKRSGLIAMARNTIGLLHEGVGLKICFIIDAIQLFIQLNADEAEIAKRHSAWQASAPRYTRGVLGKCFKLVGAASKGAVTD